MKENSFAILGLGRFGRKVAMPLTAAGAEVMIADSNEKKINEYGNRFTYAVTLDLRDVNALRKIGLDHIEVAIVDLSHNTDAAVMTILVAKEMGVKRVIATAATSHVAEILRRVGADEVIIPEDDAARQVAKRLISEEFMQYYDLGGEMCVIKIHPSKDWIGKSVRELDLHNKEKLNIISFEKEGVAISDFSPDYIIEEKDIIALAGHKSIIFNFV